MSPTRSGPDGLINLHTLYEKVGEVGAIAREAKHASMNASAKIDALAIVVATQGETRLHVERLERIITDQANDIELLKADKFRREGAISLVEWCSKHWPFLGFSAGLTAWVAYANGMFK